MRYTMILLLLTGCLDSSDNLVNFENLEYRSMFSGLSISNDTTEIQTLYIKNLSNKDSQMVNSVKRLSLAYGASHPTIDVMEYSDKYCSAAEDFDWKSIKIRIYIARTDDSIFIAGVKKY